MYRYWGYLPRVQWRDDVRAYKNIMYHIYIYVYIYNMIYVHNWYHIHTHDIVVKELLIFRVKITSSRELHITNAHIIIYIHNIHDCSVLQPPRRGEPPKPWPLRNRILVGTLWRYRRATAFIHNSGRNSAFDIILWNDCADDDAQRTTCSCCFAGDNILSRIIFIVIIFVFIRSSSSSCALFMARARHTVCG